MLGDVSGTIDTETTRINASGNPQEGSTANLPKTLREALAVAGPAEKTQAAAEGRQPKADVAIDNAWDALRPDDTDAKLVLFPNPVTPTAEPAIAPAKVPDHPQTIKRPLPDLRGDELGLESLPPNKRPKSETRRAVVADQIRDEARAQAAKDAARTAAELGNADRPPPSVLRRIFRIGR